MLYFPGRVQPKAEGGIYRQFFSQSYCIINFIENSVNSRPTFNEYISIHSAIIELFQLGKFTCNELQVLFCYIRCKFSLTHRENLSTTCSMDLESTLGLMDHIMRETSTRTSKPSKSDWDQIIIWVSPKLNRPTLIFLSYGMKQLIHVVRGALRKKPTNIIHLIYGSERNSWFYFPESLRKHRVSLENKTNQFPL